MPEHTNMPDSSSSSGSFVVTARELLTMSGTYGVGCVENGAVLVTDGQIEWVGTQTELPEAARQLTRVEAGIVLPAFVECHTHALFAGDRYDEFAIRNQGGSYAEILESGGGILSTVEATRKASDDELFESLTLRLDRFAKAGCAVVEVKTGYGLSHEQELRHLSVIKRCAEASPIKVVATYLGAHAIPPEYRENREGYISEICERTIPEVAEQQLASAVDVFCDRGAFTADESYRILRAAQANGLRVRIHTDELSASGGCKVAAATGACSADHLEYASEDDWKALLEADVAGVLLPGVTVFLDAEKRPEARKMVDAGIRVALSTDYNPGSSHTQNLLLMATLGCSLYKLTPAEALRAVTRVPAEILGVGDRYGRIAVGMEAKFVTSSLPSWRALPYHMAPLEPLGRVGFEDR